MTAVMALPGNTAATFLTHFFGPGLADDDRYVVERFKAMADGDIRRCPDAAPAAKSARRKAKAATVTLKAVKELRPAPTEIIVCTGLRTRGGVPYWGSISTAPLSVHRRPERRGHGDRREAARSCPCRGGGEGW